MKNYQTKGNWKNDAQCPFIKASPLSYGSGFFWKEDIIMHSLLKKWKKTHFLMKFHQKVFNFKKIQNLINVYHYHAP
jgi:hypothetical protein